MRDAWRERAGGERRKGTKGEGLERMLSPKYQPLPRIVFSPDGLRPPHGRTCPGYLFRDGVAQRENPKSTSGGIRGISG